MLLAKVAALGALQERASIIDYYERVNGIGLPDVESGKHWETK